MNYGKWIKISFDRNDKRWAFHMAILNYIFKNDLKLKRVHSNYYMAIMCGSKNVKKIIEEINLLNFCDETFIW